MAHARLPRPIASAAFFEWRALLLLWLSTCCAATGAQKAASQQAPARYERIRHVVVIVQENRSVDNLFQDPVLFSRGADISSTGLNSLDQTIALSPIDLGTTGSKPQNYDLSHGHPAFINAYNGGKMNGANKIGCHPNTSADVCPPNPQYMYVEPADVQPYFTLAENYVFADRMFQTNQGPSFPAHQFIFGGTSAPTATSTLFAAENPTAGATGCIAPAAQTVQMIDAAGSETAFPAEYPCFEHATLSDLLMQAGVSWRYYTPSAGSIWTAPNAIRHICMPESVSGVLTCTGSQWSSNVVIPETGILTDIANQQLAQVSWVIPDGLASDHAGANDGSGPSWVASVVNAIGNSNYWADTAILITWDDWGGWYDHVAPTIVDDGVSWGSGYVYGLRVPLIVVSPYARPSYISHVRHDFGSILQFIEGTFHLGSLGYADAYSDNLADCFNFSQNPIPFQPISAKFDATYFLTHQHAPVPPDDD
jgi:phospholipase C